MWPASIIQIKVATQPSSRVSDRIVGMKINFFVLDRSPQLFNEHNITLAALQKGLGELSDEFKKNARGSASVM